MADVTNESGLRTCPTCGALPCDQTAALISPAGEVVVPVASPLERERFLSILDERLEAAFNAGAEWAQGFDSRREAHGVLDLLSAAPGGMEG